MQLGPLYEQAVAQMARYRRIAARIPKAKTKTAGRLDHTLEGVSERLGELLTELTVQERTALIGWQAGIMPDYYEVDHEELMGRPYASIRRVLRWTEEVDVHPRKDIEAEELSEEFKQILRDKLQSLRSSSNLFK